jgi:cell division protein FtsZ
VVAPPTPVEPLFRPEPMAAPAPEAEPEPEAAVASEQIESDVAGDLAAGELELTEEEDGATEAETAKSGYASLTGVRPSRAEPLDLGLDQVDEQAESGGGDELLLDASRLAQEDGPVSPLVTRRRGPGQGGGGAGGGGRSSVAGNTLFERMANLSRGVKPASADDEDDDEDEDDGAAISIPRFLGRQNNQ